LPIVVSRAQAAGSWNVTACCVANPTDCNDNYCHDRTASSDFIFRLQPGEPQQFLPTHSGGTAGFRYQQPGPAYWPMWGDKGDLKIGTGPLGKNGYCHQGGTYAGSVNATCGGAAGSWGATDMEVWFPTGPAPPPAPGPAVTCDPNASPTQYCPDGKACPACGKASCTCPKATDAASVDM
jgi:hypothetical protein